MDDHLGLSDSELDVLFHRLFPDGFAGSDVLLELAPGGWENSPLIRAFHPTLEQWHEERVIQHRHLEELDRIWRDKRNAPEPAKPRPPEPTLDDSRREFTITPVDPRAECTRVVGAVTWEIFSDNHTVFAADGREIELGSWRAASSFLSGLADGRAAADAWHRGDSMRFYMGLVGIRGRCDYGPVYRMVFRRLQRECLDWRYTFPRLHVFRFERDASEQTAPHEYSPSDAFAREEERRAGDAEFARMQAEMEEAHRNELEKARTLPPPPVVQAYRDVFGHWPDGWPP